jgi:hypothetical protein
LIDYWAAQLGDDGFGLWAKARGVQVMKNNRSRPGPLFWHTHSSRSDGRPAYIRKTKISSSTPIARCDRKAPSGTFSFLIEFRCSPQKTFSAAAAKESFWSENISKESGHLFQFFSRLEIIFWMEATRTV